MNDEVKEALKSISGGDINTFVDNYRAALKEQYDADTANLNNQRNLDYTTINSTANVKGMLHSNFPTRDKLKYDVSTYDPNMIKLRQSYQTGLDSLYSNAAKYYNTIRQYQQQIADYNEAASKLNS